MSTAVYFKGTELLELLRLNAQCNSPLLHPRGLPRSPLFCMPMRFCVPQRTGARPVRYHGDQSQIENSCILCFIRTQIKSDLHLIWSGRVCWWGYPIAFICTQILELWVQGLTGGFDVAPLDLVSLWHPSLGVLPAAEDSLGRGYTGTSVTFSGWSGNEGGREGKVSQSATSMSMPWWSPVIGHGSILVPSSKSSP